MQTSSVLIFALALVLGLPAGPSYQTEIEKWRQRREAELKADDGWLTVAGLFWLKEGRNTVGTDPGNAIVLPQGSAPGLVGEFEFSNGTATFRPAPGAKVTVNEKFRAFAKLKPDTSGSPDLVRIHDLTLIVIKRGSRYAIRLKDKNSEMRKKFTGLKFYPVNEQCRIKAKFVPYIPPKMIAIPDILGDTEQEASPGHVVFSIDGGEYQLDPIVDEGKLFFIFKDLTSGKETYPAGRFLYTDLPKNGEVNLDFNKAYNPPCAFTPFATCPLPPKQNILPVRIEAGELRYGH